MEIANIGRVYGEWFIVHANVYARVDARSTPTVNGHASLFTLPSSLYGEDHLPGFLVHACVALLDGEA